jgi:hypothetical protein
LTLGRLRCEQLIAGFLPKFTLAITRYPPGIIMNCDDRWKTPDIDCSCGHSYAPSRKVAGVFHNCVECLNGLRAVADALLARTVALIGFGMDSFRFLRLRDAAFFCKSDLECMLKT